MKKFCLIFVCIFFIQFLQVISGENCAPTHKKDDLFLTDPHATENPNVYLLKINEKGYIWNTIRTIVFIRDKGTLEIPSSEDDELEMPFPFVTPNYRENKVIENGQTRFRLTQNDTGDQPISVLVPTLNIGIWWGINRVLQRAYILWGNALITSFGNNYTSSPLSLAGIGLISTDLPYFGLMNEEGSVLQFTGDKAQCQQYVRFRVNLTTIDLLPGGSLSDHSFFDTRSTELVNVNEMDNSIRFIDYHTGAVNAEKIFTEQELKDIFARTAPDNTSWIIGIVFLVVLVVVMGVVIVILAVMLNRARKGNAVK